MAQALPYRITRQVPLVRLETFCRSLQEATDLVYDSSESADIWRLHISAECPACGIRTSGEELRALAFPPCAEFASAKIGRMRLGSCARHGCEAWDYSVHLWNQEGIDWPILLKAADKLGQAIDTSPKVSGHGSLAGFGQPAASYAVRVAGMLGIVFTLWLARELYLGGRIPLLREPEKFKIDTTPYDNTWPAPMDRTWN